MKKSKFVSYSFDMQQYGVLMYKKKFLGITINQSTKKVGMQPSSCTCDYCIKVGEVIKNFLIKYEFDKAQTPAADKYEGQVFVTYKSINEHIKQTNNSIADIEKDCSLTLFGEENNRGIYCTSYAFGKREKLVKLIIASMEQKDAYYGIFKEAVEEFELAEEARLLDQIFNNIKRDL